MGRNGRFGFVPDRLPEWAMSRKITKKQRLAAIASIVAGFGLAVPAWAQPAPDTAMSAGFYGGVAMREPGADSVGLSAGPVIAQWTQLAVPPADDTSTRMLVFGGYRWRNDVSLEAAFSSADKYSLRPNGGVTAQGGVRFGAGNANFGLTDVQSRAWNVDVYTSWAFYKQFALYGRLGYAQADVTPLFGSAATGGNTADTRRLRDGMNYGLGLRYGINSNLGLRLEYSRFARFGIDTGSATLPESDQVRFGMQFRF